MRIGPEFLAISFLNALCLLLVPRSIPVRPSRRWMVAAWIAAIAAYFVTPLMITGPLNPYLLFGMALQPLSFAMTVNRVAPNAVHVATIASLALALLCGGTIILARGWVNPTPMSVKPALVVAATIALITFLAITGATRLGTDSSS